MPAAHCARPKSAAAMKLGLAAVQFSLDEAAGRGRGRMTFSETRAALATALQAGLRLIDAGPQKGDAECAIGRLLPRGGVEEAEVRLIAKTAPLSAGLNMVETAARSSLRRMKIARAAAIVVSDASDLLGAEGPALWGRLKRLKDEGLYAGVGICAAAAEDPVGLARRFKPDLMQIPLSVLDQRLAANGALEALAAMGVEIQLKSVFQHGLLFVPHSGLPEGLAGAGPGLSRIRRAIAEAGADPLQAALAFALSRPEASAVIVRIASAAELRAVIAAASAPAPTLDWSALKMDDPAALDPRMWAAA